MRAARPTEDAAARIARAYAIAGRCGCVAALAPPGASP